MNPKLRSYVLAGAGVLLGACAAQANEASDRIFEKAMASFQGDDTEQAAYLFEQAVIADPAIAQTRFWLGRSYWENEEAAKAQRAFNQTVTIDPGFREAFYWGGLADIQQDDKEAAEEKYEWLVKLCGEECKEAADLRSAIDKPEEEAFLDLFSKNEEGEEGDEENTNGGGSNDGDSGSNAQ
ncbi:MAG: tetratricopeptide repeat protein [Hyphomicrobiales bacterium]|nr:tetratricopeptide repeat protein [Hyphomicrobiales bacterium]